MNPSESVLLRRIASAGGVPLSSDELIRHLYGVSGGPLTARNCIRTHIYRLRKVFGHPIKSLKGRGKSGYWL